MDRRKSRISVLAAALEARRAPAAMALTAPAAMALMDLAEARPVPVAMARSPLAAGVRNAPHLVLGGGRTAAQRQTEQQAGGEAAQVGGVVDVGDAEAQDDVDPGPHHELAE